MQAFLEFENQHNDQLFYHLLNKRVPEFWKCWASKFRCNLTKHIYDSNKPSEVAHAFADHFGSVYVNSADASAAKSEFDSLFLSYAKKILIRRAFLI